MIKARKSLGQHFLKDKRVAARVIEVVAPTADDIVVEIGPGTGALTSLLTERSAKVIAVEIDPRLVTELRRKVPATNLDIVEDDALTLDWRRLIESVSRETNLSVRVVGNLPYYISTPIIQRLIRLGRIISDMTFMLQEEVVDRIVSGPGGRQYGYMSVLVQYRCFARKALRVAPSAFRPTPKVWSAVIKLDMREAPAVAVGDQEGFLSFVRSTFSQRRKTVLNNLKASLNYVRSAETIEAALIASGLGVSRRAETLSVEEFAALYRLLNPENMAEAKLLV